MRESKGKSEREALREGEPRRGEGERDARATHAPMNSSGHSEVSSSSSSSAAATVEICACSALSASTTVPLTMWFFRATAIAFLNAATS